MLKVALLVLSLGVDTLVVAVSLGSAGAAGRLRIAAVFATAEALMPLVGLAIGTAAGRLVGRWASLAGGVALVVLGAWMVLRRDDDDLGDDDEVVVERVRPARLAGWALVGAALGISLDELAVGASIGLLGVPVILTLALVAGQSFVFTYAGMAFGRRLRPFLGERVERAAGAALGLLGVWTLFAAAGALRLGG